MSCSHAAASTSPASAPRAGARQRARAATPRTCAHRRGSESSSRVRAKPSAQDVNVSSMTSRLRTRGGTFTDVACRLETSETSRATRESQERSLDTPTGEGRSAVAPFAGIRPCASFVGSHLNLLAGGHEEDTMAITERDRIRKLSCCRLPVPRMRRKPIAICGALNGTDFPVMLRPSSSWYQRCQ